MDDLDLFQRFGVALAIGLLMGLERGWHGRDEPEGGRIAGLRTFALVGLLGGVSGWLVSLTGAVVLAFGFLGLAGLLALSYRVRLSANDDLGLTTEVALLLTFALRAASLLGKPAPPAAIAVVAALLLTMKKRLHSWVARIEQLELEALLKLADLARHPAALASEARAANARIGFRAGCPSATTASRKAS
ncbi:MgtC/SapB family protein [Ovoidimarina sediminis]|uniref:MgtC/SapB family protein n=1 Tax=Ovoidimarina sediminis TaxID=3079856 RepID=UPI00290FD398|nr:MgtC/SapB family protein [Rhodophyticola sp. MJ-SS7]MDU8946387.1 MgtC/SapB family protein [Rhodophyticola sp. MJ-SS7]